MAESFAKESLCLKADENGGEVRIADEVIAVIAGIAATEVPGVRSMAGNISHEIIGRLGMQTLSKGVKISIDETGVKVELSLIVDPDHRIRTVSTAVQDRVKNALESMTGLTVRQVDVRIAGIDAV